MWELSEKAKSLIQFSQQGGRICPQPTYWNELWQLLPNREQKASGGWIPPLPLILAAWWETTGLEKMLRVREHIEWADSHGAIDPVDSYLRGLDEVNWFHGKD